MKETNPKHWLPGVEGELKIKEEGMTYSAFMAVENESRFIRTVSDNTWVSVTYRLTFSGSYEWETAICTKSPPTCKIVRGDRRTELESLPEAEVLAWRDAHQEKYSPETLLDLINKARTG